MRIVGFQCNFGNVADAQHHFRPRYLRLARLEAGLSQSALARTVDAERAASLRVQINRWESGRIVPTEESLGPVAMALGVTVASLYE